MLGIIILLIGAICGFLFPTFLIEAIRETDEKIANTAKETRHTVTLSTECGFEYLNLFPFFDLKSDAILDTPSCIIPNGQKREQ